MDADDASPMKGIVLKVLSVVVFVCMSTCIKAAGDDIPTGQITFYRSAFAMVPILGFWHAAAHCGTLSGPPISPDTWCAALSAFSP